MERNKQIKINLQILSPIQWFSWKNKLPFRAFSIQPNGNLRVFCPFFIFSYIIYMIVDLSYPLKEINVVLGRLTTRENMFHVEYRDTTIWINILTINQQGLVSTEHSLYQLYASVMNIFACFFKQKQKGGGWVHAM